MYSLLLFEEIFYFVVHWHQPLSLPDHAKLQVIVYNWGGGCCGRQFVILRECFLQPLSVLVVPLGPPGWQRPGGELIKVIDPVKLCSNSWFDSCLRHWKAIVLWLFAWLSCWVGQDECLCPRRTWSTGSLVPVRIPSRSISFPDLLG